MMEGAQFLLWVNLARTAFIAVLVCWLIFTRAKAPKMRTVCATGLMILLASNIFAAAMAVNVFGVHLW